MKIIVDAFGGDHAPDEILKGCVMAAEEYGVELVLTGDRGEIEKAAKRLSLEAAVGQMEILHCTQVLSMETEPGAVLKEMQDSSMAVGLRALAAGKGDAFASAGNSGALVVGATMMVKRIKGIKRVTFAPVMPKKEGFFMLADGGANVDCRPVMLQQFALMGSVYMNKVMGIDAPAVALVNVGEEAHKGDSLRQETYKLLEKDNRIRFVGNIEGREVPGAGADVVITDGFTGNVMLKLYEGVAGTLMGKIKNVFEKRLLNKLAAAVVLKDMRALKSSVDYNEYGGAPVMGAKKPVFKIHGSAKARTVKNALKLTCDYAKSGITEEIAQAMAGQAEESMG